MAERLRAAHASRWFDPALALLLTSVCLVELFARPDLTDSPWGPVVLLVAGATIAVRCSHPAAAAGVQAIVLVVTPSVDDAFLPDSSVMLVSTVAYSFGAHATRRGGLIAVGVLAACMQIGVGFSEFRNFEIYFETLGPWWVGVQVSGGAGS